MINSETSIKPSYLIVESTLSMINTCSSCHGKNG